MNNYLFNKALIIGVGLIGSSLARGLKNKKISKFVYGFDINEKTKKTCLELNIVDTFLNNLILEEKFDIIIICSPLSSYKKILSDINSSIKSPCIITDVGSTKVSVVKDFNDFAKNDFLEFVPGHPIAGLEKSGPEYGFEDIFKNRYCILIDGYQKKQGYISVKKMWEQLGMIVEVMNSEHHDRVLAMTSHIPQLIAYSIVATSTELEESIKEEVIKYSAAGFRDFTRLAGSDPTMWRDVYLLNKDAVLEMLNRFSEDLSILQKAIINEDGKKLEKIFSATREIRKQIENYGQAGTFDPREKKS